MRKVSVLAALIALLCLGSLAQADISIDTVPVGDPGNVGELSGEGAGGYGFDRICGSVGYAYNIGKYEITAGQYTDFLNHKASSDPYGLYRPYMADPSWTIFGCNIQRSGSDGSYVYTVDSDWANRPVNYVSCWDACRFANWLHNGQGSGDTETGAYTVNGYNGWDGRTIQRNPGAKWFLTSEDEWYKAAYYKGGGTNVGYWEYPTRSDTAPGNQVVSPDPGNEANYYVDPYTIGSPYWRTSVGEFENSASAYGTFDQGGNVWEWNDTIVIPGSDFAARGLRGGSFIHDDHVLRASYRGSYTYPTDEFYEAGFRVAYVPEGWQPVPEPGSLLAMFSGLAGLGVFIRRRG